MAVDDAKKTGLLVPKHPIKPVKVKSAEKVKAVKKAPKEDKTATKKTPTWRERNAGVLKA